MSNDERLTILVNGRPHHVNKPHLTAEEIRALVNAPGDYEVWKVVRDPDPEGQLPVDDQQVTEAVDIKSGDRFRVVPPGTFGASAVLTDAIRDAAEVLESMGHDVSLHEHGGQGVLLIAAYPLSRGWSKKSTRLLLILPPSYPAGKPDMFWVDRDLLLEGGAVPKQADHIEVILGESWRRFSWHPSSWTPGVDDIRSYLEFVARRLAHAQ
jgi:hypothetical protein